MKRKFLSILLTLAMALTLLPTAAMAEGEPAEVPAGEGSAPPNMLPRSAINSMRRWLRLLRQLQMAALSCCWLM